MDVNSLSHTRWECKYHIVFAPKFRRKVAYGELKQDMLDLLYLISHYCYNVSIALQV